MSMYYDYNNQYKPYNAYNGYNPQPNINVLPPQQILQANGKTSIDMVKMSPNSSVLIADTTAPIVWKCTSDGLGNVTAEPFDISPHKDEEQKQNETIVTSISNIDERLKKLEVAYESIINRNEQSEYVKNTSNNSNNQKYKKSTSNVGTGNE